MRYEYTESHGAILRLRLEEPTLARAFFEERGEKLLAIAWNRGPEQQVWIDEVPVVFPAGHAITLVVSQSFSL